MREDLEILNQYLNEKIPVMYAQGNIKFVFLKQFYLYLKSNGIKLTHREVELWLESKGWKRGVKYIRELGMPYIVTYIESNEVYSNPVIKESNKITDHNEKIVNETLQKILDERRQEMQKDDLKIWGTIKEYKLILAQKLKLEFEETSKLVKHIKNATKEILTQENVYHRPYRSNTIKRHLYEYPKDE